MHEQNNFTFFLLPVIKIIVKNNDFATILKPSQEVVQMVRVSNLYINTFLTRKNFQLYQARHYTARNTHVSARLGPVVRRPFS